MKNIHVFSFVVSGLLLFMMGTVAYGQKYQDTVNWKLVWKENFRGRHPDPSTWSIIDRNQADWGNYMSDYEDCIVMKGGKLYLRGIMNDKVPEDTALYLTGGLRSRGKFAFQYGKIEIKAKLESGTGAWPALWMLADEDRYGQYPRNGEIDLMERLNYDQYVYQTIHTYYTLVLGNDSIPQRYTTVPVDPDEFNTYGLEWFPDRLVFTVNGTPSFSYPRLENVDPSQWPFDQPFYLILSMQLGGSWVGEVDPEDLPVQMIIDWIRVYEER